MKRPAHTCSTIKARHRQDGHLLLAPLLLALLFSLFWRFAPSPGDRQLQRSQQALLQAREALLARAVTDLTRPGSLPCPDRSATAGSSTDGDGIADLLAGQHCPHYLGPLPWATLATGDLRDDSGSRLWYALSPSLRDDSSAQPINSDTLAQLSLNGQGDIAALLIAPRQAMAGQHRPGSTPADALDPANADGDLHYQTGGGNDLLLPLTRQQLMRALEIRVGRETLHCLNSHAQLSGRRPWPAPLDDPLRRGRAGSLFGRLPLTQAAPGLSTRLAAWQSETRNLRNALTTPLSTDSAATLLAQANALGDALLAGQQLFDQTWQSARQLQTLATQARQALGQLEKQQGLFLGSSSAPSLGSALGASTPVLQALSEQLQATGSDAFPVQLDSLSRSLRDAGGDALRLDTTLGLLAPVLGSAASTNPAIAAALANSQSLLSAAQGRNRNLPDEGLRLQNSLAEAVQALAQTVLTQRLELPAEEFTGLATLFEALPSPGNAAELRQLLLQTDAQLAQVQHGQAGTLSLAASIRRQLGAGTLTPDSAAILLRQLAEAMGNNDDNLSQSSLRQHLATLNPLLNGIAPPSAATLAATRSLGVLCDLLAAEAERQASASRRSLGSSDGKDGSDALYTLAGNALNTFTGSTGVPTRLAQYAASPTTTRRNSTTAAITQALAATDTLLQQSARLADQLGGSTAAATPIVWRSPACSALRSNGEIPGWWQANAWERLVFYQIAATDPASPARLSLTTGGSAPLVVILAGSALKGQNRTASGALAGLGNYLEDINAHPSRLPPATAPLRQLRQGAPDAAFNDQLFH